MTIIGAIIVALSILGGCFFIVTLGVLIALLKAAIMLLPIVIILAIAATVYGILKWKKMRIEEKSILERVYTIGFNILTGSSIVCLIGMGICFFIKSLIAAEFYIIMGILAIGLISSLITLAMLAIVNKLLLKIKYKEFKNTKWW